MDAKVLQQNLLELIRRTSAELPSDVVRVIDKGWRREKKDSSGKYALEVIRDNIAMARDKSEPLGQDTGAIIGSVELSVWMDENTFMKCNDKFVV